MGQRMISALPAERIGGSRCIAGERPRLSLFLTDLGWFGLLGAGTQVCGLTIGHPTADSSRQAMLRQFDSGGSDEPGESDWFPDLRRRLEAYASGDVVAFDDVEVEPASQTEFQRSVINATRRLAYGETATYAQLAERVGSPRAARAVGSVMAGNRVPIIVPCHRVVAAGGRLGGFSAPQGIRLKEQMLALEAGFGGRVSGVG